MINPAIQRSIEIQEAAKECNVIKPKMARIVNRVNKSFPHYSAGMIAEIITEAKETVIGDDWTSDEIATLVIDIIKE